MVITTERETWPLYQCLKPQCLAKLILYQWDKFGLKLDLMVDIYRDAESIEEIDQLMRERPRWKGKVWFGG